MQQMRAAVFASSENIDKVSASLVDLREDMKKSDTQLKKEGKTRAEVSKQITINIVNLNKLEAERKDSVKALQSETKAVQKAGNELGIYNDEIEANQVVEIVQDILINRKSNETIGIITFNAQQKGYSQYMSVHKERLWWENVEKIFKNKEIYILPSKAEKRVFSSIKQLEDYR
jgi:septal ring factor EnvC (AmiA/AmiB activator)